MPVVHWQRLSKTFRHVLLVLLAVAAMAGSIAYGLKGPPVYDSTVDSYTYPHRPYRTAVLTAGLALAAVAPTATAFQRTTRPPLPPAHV